MHIQSKGTFHDEFLQENFSVDVFLQNYSSIYTLEGLRDALSLHLRSLETKMIDIVNSESDTILSLSSSLNGLDERIENLRLLLEQLKEEIIDTLRLIEYNMKTIKNLWTNKKNTETERLNFINAIQAVTCCSQVIKIITSDNYTKPLQSDYLLRAVDQYILHRIHLSKCDQSLLSNNEKNDITLTNNLIFDSYKDSFLVVFEKRDLEELKALLKIGVFLKNQQDTENLIRKNIVSPKLNSIMTEKSLSNKGLQHLYQEILTFISNDLEFLFKLTSEQNRKEDGITGYNFFINSVWVDIEEKLRINLNSIFAPGNPIMFQSRFTETMNFIKQLNRYTKKSASIYTHSSYDNHMKRWNLPVYFQICFNDITFSYEKILVQKDLDKMYCANSATTTATANDFKLLATSKALQSIQRCLAPDVFIHKLADKFFKLILQILARYVTWVDEQLLKNTTCDTITADDIDQINFDQKIKFLVSLHCDINQLSSKIQEIDLKMLSKQVRKTFIQGIKIFSGNLLKKLNQVENSISKSISDYSVSALTHVYQIPRLYRKTNRSIPTEPAPYVYQVLKPPEIFSKNYQNMLGNPIYNIIINNIYQTISKGYAGVINEILTQVRKTEDSLRRLKKIRQSQNSGDASSVIGDDQKIRIQLQHDINYFCDELTKRCVNIDLTFLKDLVKDA